jgi:hypothetical protein
VGTPLGSIIRDLGVRSRHVLFGLSQLIGIVSPVGRSGAQSELYRSRRLSLIESVPAEVRESCCCWWLAIGWLALGLDNAFFFRPRFNGDLQRAICDADRLYDFGPVPAVAFALSSLVPNHWPVNFLLARHLDRETDFHPLPRYWHGVMHDETVVGDRILQPGEPFEVKQQLTRIEVRVLVAEQLATPRVGFRSDRNVPLSIEVVILEMIQRQTLRGITESLAEHAVECEVRGVFL